MSVKKVIEFREVWISLKLNLIDFMFVNSLYDIGWGYLESLEIFVNKVICKVLDEIFFK